jgi:hypothetical protein
MIGLYAQQRDELEERGAHNELLAIPRTVTLSMTEMITPSRSKTQPVKLCIVKVCVSVHNGPGSVTLSDRIIHDRARDWDCAAGRRT